MANCLTYKSQGSNRWELKIMLQYKNTEVKVTLFKCTKIKMRETDLDCQGKILKVGQTPPDYP